MHMVHFHELTIGKFALKLVGKRCSVAHFPSSFEQPDRFWEVWVEIQLPKWPNVYKGENIRNVFNMC